MLAAAAGQSADPVSDDPACAWIVIVAELLAIRLRRHEEPDPLLMIDDYSGRPESKGETHASTKDDVRCHPWLGGIIGWPATLGH